mgnify:CR=1 FL=1
MRYDEFEKNGPPGRQVRFYPDDAATSVAEPLLPLQQTAHLRLSMRPDLTKAERRPCAARVVVDCLLARKCTRKWADSESAPRLCPIRKHPHWVSLYCVQRAKATSPLAMIFKSHGDVGQNYEYCVCGPFSLRLSSIPSPLYSYSN